MRVLCGLASLAMMLACLDCALFSPQYLTAYPVYEDSEFVMKFTSNSPLIPAFDCLVYRVYSKSSLLQQVVLTPGFFKTLDKPIMGGYIQVDKYDVDRLGDVTVTMRFHRAAQRLQLFVYYVKAGDLAERRRRLRDLTQNSEFGMPETTIELYLHWTLTLRLATRFRERGLVHGRKGTISCEAKGGRPRARVRILGLDNLHVLSRAYDETKNVDSAEVIARIEDHGKKVGCEANNDVILEDVVIYHNPSGISFDPEINGFVKNGTSIRCVSINGYPTVTPRWSFEYGPMHPGKYFLIDNQHGVLNVLSSAPRNTKWKFSCLANNSYVHSPYPGAERVLEFTVGDKPVPIVIIVSITAGVIAGVLFLVLIACVIASRTRRRPPPPEAKTALSEETDLTLKLPLCQNWSGLKSLPPAVKQAQPSAPIYPVHEV